jgi:hypothetical protein
MYSKKIQSVFLFVAVFIATTGLPAYAGDTGIVTGRIVDGKIVAERGQPDLFGLLKQIGGTVVE